MAEIREDVSRHFADMVADTTSEDVRGAAADAAKKSVLDTLGVALAASGVEPAVRAALDLVQETGGREEAHVLGRWEQVPAMMAAFANGALAHGLDFDDQTPWGQHSASSIVPATLALAERRGGVTGRQLIAAVAVGQDIFARLRCHVGWRKDWNLSSVLGVFPATAASAKVLDLTRDQAHHALGIASQQSSGVMEVVAGTGSDLRGLYAGFSAKGAVLAALLAERNVSGVENLFEGQYGIFNTYFGGEYDREAMLADLGSEYRGASTLYKMWPAVGTAHSHIHATVQIVTEKDLSPGDIEQIRVHVGDYHLLMCTPLATRRLPATLVDAKFSLPFLVAIAAVRRGMGVSDFTDSGLQDPEVRAVAQRVIPVKDHRLDWKLELPPGYVEVITRDGRSFGQEGKNVPGRAGVANDMGRVGEQVRRVRGRRPPATFARADRGGRRVGARSGFARRRHRDPSDALMSEITGSGGGRYTFSAGRSVAITLCQGRTGPSPCHLVPTCQAFAELRK
jgi:2-methylcitrate dehydratase PrpD